MMLTRNPERTETLPGTRLPRLARRGCVFAGLLLLLSSCAPDSEKSLPPNLPPLTYLSIDAVLPDTLDYRLPLHWWGTDVDGRVVGYYIRWSGDWEPPADAPRWAEDSTWVFTTATADTFSAPTGPAPGTDPMVVAPDTFMVRAVDDRGAIDPQGRSQVFTVRNWVPTLRWDASLPLPRTSICVVSFAVRPSDPDGRETVHLEYWLDGSDSTLAWTTPDSVIVLTPEEFEGRYGERTLSVRAVDDSQTPSREVIHHTWTVEPPPENEFLLVDQAPSTVSGSIQREDPFFTEIMNDVTGGDYYLLDLEQKTAFRTRQDVYGFLVLFRGALWYSGAKDTRNDLAFGRTLAIAQDGIGRYLDQGGRLLLVASNAVGDSAGLSVAFAEDRLGLNGFYRRGSTNIDILGQSIIYAPSATGADSLKLTWPSAKADFMLVRRSATPLFFVPPGFLRPFIFGSDTTLVVPDQSEDPAYLGVLNEHQGSRFAAVTFLLSRSNGFENWKEIARATVGRVLLDEPGRSQ